MSYPLMPSGLGIGGGGALSQMQTMQIMQISQDEIRHRQLLIEHERQKQQAMMMVVPPYHLSPWQNCPDGGFISINKVTTQPALKKVLLLTRRLK